MNCRPCTVDADYVLRNDQVEPLPTPPGTLGPDARALYRFIEIFAAEQNLEPPHLLSTCRSREEQLNLQRRWDAGDREGIRARPADPDTSKHVADEHGICHAFDLFNSDSWLRTVGQHVVKTFPGARWGGNWLPPDLPHFDVQPSRRWIRAASFKI